MARDVGRAAEDVHDVDGARHVGELPVDLPPEDLLRLGVVHRHRHHLHARVHEVPRHVERGLVGLRLGLDAEHRHAPRRAQELGDAAVVVEQVVAPVGHGKDPFGDGDSPPFSNT
jgi:hypothetical protein